MDCYILIRSLRSACCSSLLLQVLFLSSSAAITTYVALFCLICIPNWLVWTLQYIARKLLKINERGVWSDPPPTDAAQRALQDEQIFQTARLIKSVIFRHLFVLFITQLSLPLSSGGHFMSVIMGDYVAGFLGSSEGCNWNMNAFDVCQC